MKNLLFFLFFFAIISLQAEETKLPDPVLNKKTGSNKTEWINQPTLEDQKFLYSKSFFVNSEHQLDKNEISIDIRWIEQHLNKLIRDRNGNSKLSVKEKILLFLLKIRERNAIFSIVQYIPFPIQRAVKRYLSSRPVHELFFRNY